jgi:hypothetical protein
MKIFITESADEDRELSLPGCTSALAVVSLIACVAAAFQGSVRNVEASLDDGQHWEIIDEDCGDSLVARVELAD